MRSRLDNEFLSGKHTADLLDIPGNAAWRTYSKKQLDPWMPASANGLKSDYQVIGPGNAWVTPYQKLNGILYNSDQVKKEGAPKSWMDLLESKWRGKVVITDPRQIGASSGVLVQLTHAKLVPDNYIQRFAPDWHCDLMEQLSDYRACASMSLSDIAFALGLPGKIGVFICLAYFLWLFFLGRMASSPEG